jgi:hypothetical protein
MALLSPSMTALLLSGLENKISAATTRRRRGACKLSIAATVRASASPGDETALGHALYFDIACSYLLKVSPLLRGSSPYPCGSLAYRAFAYTSLYKALWHLSTLKSGSFEDSSSFIDIFRKNKLFLCFASVFFRMVLERNRFEFYNKEETQSQDAIKDKGVAYVPHYRQESTEHRRYTDGR